MVSEMAKHISFKFAPEKAMVAIQWMVHQKPQIDLHTLLKACYFADKEHLNEYGRPVFGATYRAMKFGPVPLEIYEMAKGEALWLAELDRETYPWRLSGFRLHMESNEPIDEGALSDSDWIALSSGFDLSKTMTFNERTAATHGPDWQAANLGYMRYEDMLADTPEKPEKTAYLVEAGPFLRL